MNLETLSKIGRSCNIRPGDEMRDPWPNTFFFSHLTISSIRTGTSFLFYGWIPEHCMAPGAPQGIGYFALFPSHLSSLPLLLAGRCSLIPTGKMSKLKLICCSGPLTWIVVESKFHLILFPAFPRTNHLGLLIER